MRAYRWEDWPGRRGPDLGIGIVAETAAGELSAVQCKAYAATTTVSTAAVDAFATDRAAGYGFV